MGFSLMDVRNATPPILDDQVIHRSRKTRAAFYDAANQVEGEVLPKGASANSRTKCPQTTERITFRL